MATEIDQQATRLFNDLQDSIERNDDDLSLDLIHQVLKLNPNDEVALHCKVITLIRLDKYADALDVINGKLNKCPIDLTFEKIYCYYRTKQYKPATDLLESVKTERPNDMKLQFLEAQLLYSQEKYKDAIAVYQSLLDSTQDVQLREEITVNLLASQACLAFESVQVSNVERIDTENYSSYEIAYNEASVLLAQGNLASAQEKLEVARKQCSSEHVEDLAIIAIQLAYTYQLEGRVTEAKELYESVLKTSSTDTACRVTVNNNLMAAKATGNIFDTAKRIKTFANKEAESKLRKYQRRVVDTNEALLQLYMNKHAQCREMALKLVNKYPQSDAVYLILAATTMRSSTTDKAIEELRKYASEHPSSLALHFAMMQLQLLDSRPAAALATLESYLKTEKADKEYVHKPAIVALHVWLLEQTDQLEKAAKVLDTAARHWKQEKSSLGDKQASSGVLKQMALSKLRAGRYQEALKDYEQLVRVNPSDEQAVAGLIWAYAEVDPSKAEQYGKMLPDIPLHDIAVETLETQLSGVKRGYARKDPSAHHVKKTRTKKRKPLLPKLYDANKSPDPERWIPKYARSTYRAKGKNKKQAARGPQGAVAKETSQAATTTTTATTTSKPANKQSAKSGKKKKNRR